MKRMDLNRILRTALLAICVCVPAHAAGAPLVELRAYGRAQDHVYSWDPVAKNAVLEGPSGSFRFHVGSDYYLKNGRLEKMTEPASFREDSVVVPASAVSAIPAEVPAVSHRLRRVVIDAGHGGKDPGATSPRGLEEKRVTLEVATEVKRLLERAGVEVVMTRSADVFIPLSQRAHIANKNNADLFVSIHANASTSPSLSGFELYTLSEATDDGALAVERAENAVIQFEPSARAAMSEKLETILWDLKETANRKQSIRAGSHIADHVVSAVETQARRQKSANFYVLKWTECPAVLVELAYLTNRADERKLRDPGYRSQIAEGVARGILSYRDEFEHTNGFTE
jgi:N-acetylmuramoyl-L-alanine amidase